MNDNAEYLAYLQSPQWKARRLELFAARGAKCEICQSKKLLHLHHLTYVRLYDELDSDLAIVCDECHGAIHNRWALFRKRVVKRAMKERRKQIAYWRKHPPDRSYRPPVETPDLKDKYSIKAVRERLAVAKGR